MIRKIILWVSLVSVMELILLPDEQDCTEIYVCGWSDQVYQCVELGSCYVNDYGGESGDL